VSGERADSLVVSGSEFQGTLTPRASAEYRLALVTAAGIALGGDTVRLPIRVLADAAPEIEVPVPGADTVAPLSMRLPLVIDVRDDHGLTAVVLELRRQRRGRAPDSLRAEPIALPEGRPDRAVLAHELDLGRLGLEPGDTLRYRARAVDNSPGRQVARSREYLIRIPTASELRATQREATEAVGSRLDSLANRSRELERSTQDVAQTEQRKQESQSSGSGDDALSFEQAKKAEAVAQAQEQLLKDAEAVRDALEALQKSAESAGLDDPAFRQRLEELQQQLDRALTPEMREKLAELQRALQDLSAERTQEALKDLAKAQQQLREALERSRELFERGFVELAARLLGVRLDRRHGQAGEALARLLERQAVRFARFGRRDERLFAARFAEEGAKPAAQPALGRMARIGAVVGAHAATLSLGRRPISSRASAMYARLPAQP
jgi:hypothetical protein